MDFIGDIAQQWAVISALRKGMLDKRGDWSDNYWPDGYTPNDSNNTLMLAATGGSIILLIVLLVIVSKYVRS